MLTEASEPRSEFFPIRTDHKPVNTLFIFSSNGHALLKIFGNVRKSSEIFGKLWKRFKVIYLDVFMIF